MGLGLPNTGGGGNRTPIIKYDARAGRIYRIDRTNESGSWTSNEVELTNGFQAIMDLQNIETGWLSFPAGGAPDIRTVRIGNPLPERPSDKHKTGFRLYMKLGKSCGGDVREMASNAGVSIAAMDTLYDAFLKDSGANAGKLPIVALKGSLPIKSSGQGQASTNYQPVWEITGWADRPAELTGDAAATTSAATTTAQQAAPPASVAPAMASAGEEF